MAIKALVEEATRGEIKTFLIGDNLAAIRKLQMEITNWRTRHFAVRAGFLRGYLKLTGIDINHRKGTELVSDALTKVLDRLKLTEARQRLGLEKH